MKAPHWPDDQLLEYLYGLRPEDEHFRSCPECAARAEALEQARAQTAEPPDVPYEFLEAQRRRIHQRLGSPVHAWHPLRWAMSAVAIGAVALGFTFFQNQQPVHPRGADDQFYSELSALDQSSTPRAVQAIDALVEDDTQE